jgi:hypothetical protein
MRIKISSVSRGQRHARTPEGRREECDITDSTIARIGIREIKWDQCEAIELEERQRLHMTIDLRSADNYALDMYWAGGGGVVWALESGSKAFSLEKNVVSVGLKVIQLGEPHDWTESPGAAIRLFCGSRHRQSSLPGIVLIGLGISAGPRPN